MNHRTCDRYNSWTPCLSLASQELAKQKRFLISQSLNCLSLPFTVPSLRGQKVQPTTDIGLGPTLWLVLLDLPHILLMNDMRFA